MYFSSRNNTFFSFFIKLNSIFRYLMLFFCFFLIFFIWYFQVYKPIENKRNSLLQEIQSLKNKENELLANKKVVQTIYLKIQEINQNIESIISSFYKSDNENGINFLVNNAKNVNLTINNCSSNGTMCKKDVDKNVITFNCSGSFTQIIDYFKNLANSNQWLKFKAINFSNVDDCINVEGTYKFYIPKRGIDWTQN